MSYRILNKEFRRSNIEGGIKKIEFRISKKKTRREKTGKYRELRN